MSVSRCSTCGRGCDCARDANAPAAMPVADHSNSGKRAADREEESQGAVSRGSKCLRSDHSWTGMG